MSRPLVTCIARRPRGGTIAMELLFNLPIWLIALMGVIDFGEMLSNAQQVSLASRLGAEEASHATSLASAGEVPEPVLDIVGRQLAAARMSASKVILEHNAGKARAMLVWGDRMGDPPATALPVHGEYVRVTVFAKARGLMPKLLRCLGIDFSRQLLTQSVTFRYSAGPTETK